VGIGKRYTKANSCGSKHEDSFRGSRHDASRFANKTRRAEDKQLTEIPTEEEVMEKVKVKYCRECGEDLSDEEREDFARYLGNCQECAEEHGKGEAFNHSHIFSEEGHGQS